MVKTVFDAETGETLWKHTYLCPLLPKYYEGGTLATPTVAGRARSEGR